MRPGPFADLLKGWLTDVQYPHVARVQTCAEVGRWEQPCGIQVTLDDGWAALIQVVRASPPGGDGDVPVQPEHRVPWRDRDDYRRARTVSDAEAAQVPTPQRGLGPWMRASEVLGALLHAVEHADYPDVVDAEIAETARYASNWMSLRVSCADGSTLYAFCVGFLPPGVTTLSHAPREMPKEYV